MNLLITEEGWGLSSANWLIKHSAWSAKFLHDALTAAHVELQLFGDQDAMILHLMNRNLDPKSCDLEFFLKVPKQLDFLLEEKRIKKVHGHGSLVASRSSLRSSSAKSERERSIGPTCGHHPSV